MKSLLNLLACLMVLCISISYSCNNDDDDPSGCNYLSETEAEYNAVIEAANAYGADPSNPAKCQAYVNAYQAYLVDLEAHIDCAALAGQQAELQASIDAAQDSLDQLQC